MVTLEYGGATHAGRVRTDNEDTIRIDPARGFAMVADGVGGGAAGAQASAMAADIVHAHLAAEVDRIAADPGVDDAGGRAHLTAHLRRAIEAASLAIHQRGQSDIALRGMATTAVVVLAWRGWTVVGHVGDSRVYLLRGGARYQLTEDHSMARELLARGAITAEEAAAMPRNVIIRALGLQPTVEVDVVAFEIAPEDVFVLCSDGLSDLVPDDGIQALALGEAPALAAQALVEAANTAGGTDNISAVLLRAAAGGPPARASIELQVDMLRHIALFANLTFSEAARVLACATERGIREGDVIFREGDPGDRFYLVAEGAVVISTGGTGLTTIERGGHFGELALITDAPRSATAHAVAPTSLLALDRDALVWLVRHDHILAVKLLWALLGTLAERVKDLSAQVALAPR